MPKARPKSRLTPQQISRIATAVTDLSYRIRPTWDHVMQAALAVTKTSFSRQALSAHESIADAYGAKVAEYQRFRNSGEKPKLVEHDEEPWKLRIRQLETDKAELQAKLMQLDKRFVLHIANAVRLGVPTRQLEMPTEKPYKGATDVTTGRRASTQKPR